MPPSAATRAKGTTLSRAGNLIAEQVKFVGPKPKRSEIKVTNHDSPDDYEEFIPSLKDGGTVTMTGNFIPGDTLGQVGLASDFENGTIQSFVMTFPITGASWTFTAYVSNYGTEADATDKVPFEAELRISGKPVLAYSASNNLTGLTIDDNTGAATLQPVFAGGTYAYVVTLNTAAATYHVHPTAAAGTITFADGAGNSQVVLTGGVSSDVAAPGDVNFHTSYIKVKEVDKSEKVYILYVVRP